MKKVFEVYNYTEEIIRTIVDFINNNKIIIMPSDTIYGFLTKIENEERLREIKKRDQKPFLHIISKYSQLEILNINPNDYLPILQKNWPGSISFLMSDRNNKKIGVRMPDFWILKEILDIVDKPLLSTSVNFSGMESLNNIEDIIKDFYDSVDLIINDKNFKTKPASTIVDLTIEGYKIVRQGDTEFKC